MRELDSFAPPNDCSETPCGGREELAIKISASPLNKMLSIGKCLHPRTKDIKNPKTRALNIEPIPDEINSTKIRLMDSGMECGFPE